HLPLLHGPDGKKLSKRHGAASVQELRDAGYLPEAVRNYLALLGWGDVDDETIRSEEHTSELQSLAYLVCRLLLEKKKKDRTLRSAIYTATSSPPVIHVQSRTRMLPVIELTSSARATCTR